MREWLRISERMQFPTCLPHRWSEGFSIAFERAKGSETEAVAAEAAAEMIAAAVEAAEEMIVAAAEVAEETGAAAALQRTMSESCTCWMPA
mmetsp:Transcript_47448/g.103811  ORF Transcript_47448/g.103811 Transcript_47448/m.103811 type:complete len:91 (-) Transcript_47448:285-557(-)